MLKLPLQIKHTLGPIVVVIVAIMTFIFEPASHHWLAYDRYEIQALQTWRLISGNFLHTNAMHLVLNVLGLVLLWALHGEYYSVGTYLRNITLCGVATTACIFYLSPELIWYVGLSGALHGIFVWGACIDIQRGLSSGWLLILGLAIKVGYEQFAGPSAELATLIDASVAIDAHLYGAIFGLLLGGITVLSSRQPPSTSN